MKRLMVILCVLCLLAMSISYSFAWEYDIGAARFTKSETPYALTQEDMRRFTTFLDQGDNVAISKLIKSGVVGNLNSGIKYYVLEYK
jgi:hypothetical protein